MQVWSGLITQKLCVQSQKSIKKASHLCFSSKGKLANMSRNNPEHLSPREYRFSKGQCSSCQGNFPGRSELVPPHSLLLSLGTYSPNFPKCLKSKQWLHFNAKCTPVRGTSKLGFQTRQKRDRWVHSGDSQGFFLPHKNLSLSTETKLVENEALLLMSNNATSQQIQDYLSPTSLPVRICQGTSETSHLIWTAIIISLPHMYTLKGPSLATLPTWVAQDREIIYIGCLCIIKHSESTESHCVRSANNIFEECVLSRFIS